MVLACSTFVRQGREGKTSSICHWYFQSPTQRLQRTWRNARYEKTHKPNWLYRNHEVHHCSWLWSQNSTSTKSYLFQSNWSPWIRVVWTVEIRIINSDYNGYRRVWVRLDWWCVFSIVLRGKRILNHFYWHCLVLWVVVFVWCVVQGGNIGSHWSFIFVVWFIIYLGKNVHSLVIWFCWFSCFLLIFSFFSEWYSIIR